MTTTTNHLGRPVHHLRPLRAILFHRHWPAHLGAVAGVATLGAFQAGLLPTALTLMLAGAYLSTALVGDPRATWPFWLAVFVALGGTRALGLDPHLGAVAVIAPAALWWLIKRPATSGVAVQLAGLAAFGALAVAALLLEPSAALRLGGVAMLAHGAWDAWHLYRRRTVQPSGAEFCAVMDVVLGLALLFWL